MKNQECNLRSAVYSGTVRHRRFSPKAHQFSYSLYMLALDCDDVEQQKISSSIFGHKWYFPLRFSASDYLPPKKTLENNYVLSEPKNLKQRIKEKVMALGGLEPISHITMLVQVRCFGLYFSPANFYFCYDKNDTCLYMLAEVSNTPWNERHYYLVDMAVQADTKKVFHVSPFMSLDMRYSWKVNPPSDNKKHLLVHIENKDCDADTKIFDATLALKKQLITKTALFRVWLNMPVMTFKIVLGIYFQALKLFLKRIPFVPYQSSKKDV